MTNFAWAHWTVVYESDSKPCRAAAAGPCNASEKRSGGHRIADWQAFMFWASCTTLHRGGGRLAHGLRAQLESTAKLSRRGDTLARQRHVALKSCLQKQHMVLAPPRAHLWAPQRKLALGRCAPSHTARLLPLKRHLSRRSVMSYFWGSQTKVARAEAHSAAGGKPQSSQKPAPPAELWENQRFYYAFGWCAPTDCACGIEHRCSVQRAPPRCHICALQHDARRCNSSSAALMPPWCAAQQLPCTLTLAYEAVNLQTSAVYVMLIAHARPAGRRRSAHSMAQRTGPRPMAKPSRATTTCHTAARRRMRSPKPPMRRLKTHRQMSGW